MVAIQPVTLWVQGQQKNADLFSLFIVSDDLSSRAVFYYRLEAVTILQNHKTDTQIMQDGNITMDGEAYKLWDNNPSINEYAYNWAAEQLNLIII